MQLPDVKGHTRILAEKEANKVSTEALVLGLIIGLAILAGTSLWWAAFVPPVVLPVLVYRAKYRSIVGNEQRMATPPPSEWREDY
jgi:hypothetical protein